MLDGAGAGASGDDSGGAGAAGAEAFVRASFDANAAKVVKASCSADKLRLTLDGVLFDFDHDNLQPGGDDILAQVKKVGVDPYPTAHITIEGHTDNVGTDAHNDDLSLRRAATVATWLEAHGVDASRVETKGYGKRWPRVPNTTDANRAKNRRVELVVKDQKAAESCKPKPVPAPAGGTLVPVPPGGGGAADPGGLPEHGGTPGGPPSYSSTPIVAFSFMYFDKATDHDHMCFSFDPAWVKPNGPPMAYLKKDVSLADGKFVDHCPTENVIASCDRRALVPAMETYYAGMSDAWLAVRKNACVPPETWTQVAAIADAKAPSDTATYLMVCDAHQTEQKCLEFTAAADKTYMGAMKPACDPLPHPPRCPTQGAVGRCEAHGMITFFYGAASDVTADRFFCTQSTGGAWSVP